MKKARPWDILKYEYQISDKSIVDRRMSICEQCPEFFKPTKQCKICKCVMSVKTKLVHASCPKGKWGMLIQENKFNSPKDLDNIKLPNNKFNRIYFMHIPKTGGNYVHKHLVDPFTEIAKRFAIPIAVAHSTWGFRTDDSYTIAIVRDPAERTVSHFTHWVNYRKTVGEDIIINKDNFINWVNSHWKFLSNYQSKFFAYDLAQNFAVRDFDTDEIFRNLCVDKNIVFERASIVNILLKTSNLSIETLEKSLIKIFEDFGLDQETITYDPNRSDNINESSKDLYDSLSKEEKEWLRNDLCPIDTELYNSNLFFN